MSYELEFKQAALKEWKKLDDSIREQFKKKLTERLGRPRVPSAQLSGMPDCYKIKLRNAGYRLVYQVHDEVITVVVITVGKRERNEAYRTAKQRAE